MKPAQISTYVPLWGTYTFLAASSTWVWDAKINITSDYVLKGIKASGKATLGAIPQDLEVISIYFYFNDNWIFNFPAGQIQMLTAGISIMPNALFFTSKESFLDIDLKNGIYLKPAIGSDSINISIEMSKNGASWPIGTDLLASVILEFEQIENYENKFNT